MPSNCMRCGNTYAATSYNAWQAAEFINRWEGFNKALDAVEIQLPDCTEFDFPSGAAPAIQECRAAIEQTGLGLKIK